MENKMRKKFKKVVDIFAFRRYNEIPLLRGGNHLKKDFEENEKSG